jgi:TolC family type I secretion outer membrane protein
VNANTWLPAVLMSLASAAGASAQQPLPNAFSLEEAIAYALAHNPVVQSAVEETVKREAVVTSARSGLLPEIGVTSDVTRTGLEHGYPTSTPPSDLRFARTTYAVAVDMRLLAWDFHRTSLELAAARERLSASRILVDRRKQEIIFDVARLYLQVLTQQDLLHAAELARKSLVVLLDRTNELVRAGRAVPVDAIKVQTQLAQLDSDSAALEAGRTAALSSLAATMGYAGELPRITNSPPQESDGGVHDDIERLVQEAVQRRPDLQAAALDVRAASATERAAHRGLLPRIDFRAAAIQYGSQSPDSFGSFIGRLIPSPPVPSDSPSGGVNDWVIAFHVSMPVFDAGHRSSDFRAAEARANQARMDKERLELNVAREVRTAYADLNAARTRIEAMRTAVVQAQEILKNEQARYEVGRSPVNDVLAAEAAVTNMQSLLFQAQRSAAIAALAVELAIGRLNPQSPLATAVFTMA